MRRSLFLVPALVVLAASPLRAAEEGGNSLLMPNTGLSIWTIVIFLLVLAILSKFAFPKILGAVEAREAHIRELTEAAERDRAEAAALAEENRRLLEETRGRVQEALAASRTQTEQERARALEEARAEREALLARARQEIATERQNMAEAVRADAVELAMAAAQRLVQKNLDGEENRRLVLQFLAGVDDQGVRADGRRAAPAGV